MARIMALLNANGHLKPGSHAKQIVRTMISEKIDRLGPEAALDQVMDTKTEILTQIKIMCMWHQSSGR